jgi:hypothetical protein
VQGQKEVAMSFSATLPEGYDERTRMTLSPDNRIVVAHPDLPALIYNEETKQFEPLCS